MLNENHIVELLTAHLSANGYDIVQSLNTNAKGVDIIADNLKTKERLFIEVKGQTSSKEHTNRYGKEFDSKQIRNHVARAILAAMKVISNKPAGERTKAAIAFPLTKGHLKEVATVNAAIKKMDIAIYWVDEKQVLVE